MEMSGEYRIPAPRERVWAALNDPEILKASIPGCQDLQKQSDTEMTARVVTKIGPVKATFNGAVTLSNIVPPTGYTISGEGKGGVAGFAKGGADVTLDEEGDETVLRYKATAQVGGKLAQLGARLIDATAKQMADQFFGAFVRLVGNGDATVAAAPTGAVATDAAEAEQVVEEAAHDVSAIAHEAEERVEVAAARNWLGGPQMWGLLALAVIILVIALLR